MQARSKQGLRETLLRARLLLAPDERAALSRTVLDRALRLDAYRRARAVGLYAAMGAEVATSDLARDAVAAGKRVAWPLAVAGERALAYAICPADELVEGPLRTRQPPPGAPLLPLSDLDVVFVPGVAFDLACRRLGRGRGHYDATLRALRPDAVRIGLAFELQIVPELPQEPHDAPVDLVVTEARIFAAAPENPPREHAPR